MSAPRRWLPPTALAVPVAIVCVALLASALYTTFLLRGLRDDALQRRGLDVLAGIDFATRGRGPGGRMDPDPWQEAIEDAVNTQDGIVRLEILDGGGTVVAAAGEPRPDLRWVRRPLSGRGGPMHRGRSGLTGRVGLDPASVGFVDTAVRLQLAVAAVAILALVAMAAHATRTLRHSLELRTREQEERHLATLGSMAATLAHEIRNPLGAMKGLSQVAQEELPTDHAARDHLETVVAEAARLERLVGDLLLFARPREPDLRDVDLARALARAQELLPADDETPVDVRISIPGPGPSAAGEMRVRADPDALQQVLINTLRNAMEATSEGTVDVTATTRDDSVIVEVADRGPGPGPDPERLFEPFHTTKMRGSGLGLPVSRELVRRMGGDIRLRPRQGGGAVCRITLPRADIHRSGSHRGAS